MIYTSNFAGTEDPLSEAGVWRGGLTVGGLWTDMEKTPGVAFRKMTSFNGTNYNDSLAFLSGFGPDQYIQGTLSSAVVSGLEAELYLRSEISANIARGYEIDCIGTSSNIYLVRWNGSGTNTVTNFDIIDGPIPATINAGSIVKASITGPTITVLVDGVLVLTRDVQAWAVANGGNYWATGNPGIGGWDENGGGVDSRFNWSSITAQDTVTGPPIGRGML